MIIANQIQPYLKDLKGAIHVGANIGEERLWYKEQGFSEVIWFEPNRDLFSVLEENIKNEKNQHAFNFGIHDRLRRAKLHISNNAGQSSSLLELGTHAIHYPEVTYIEDQEINLIRLDDALEYIGRDIKEFSFLNVDVQGVELNVLRSLGKMISKLDCIYVEVNEEELYKGCSLLPEIDEYLRQFNFIRIRTHITKAHWGDAFYIRY